MNFFSNRYDKPGRGIDPDAPQKRSFFRYIDIFRRKPMHFIKANLLYDAVGFIFALPFFIAFFFLFSAMFFCLGTDRKVIGVYGGDNGVFYHGCVYFGNGNRPRNGRYDLYIQKLCKRGTRVALERF